MHNSPESLPENPATDARFTVEEAADHFWICDEGRRVVLFIRMPAGGYFCNAVFLRQPSPLEPEFPESYHSATAIGLQADIRWRWGEGWKPMERIPLKFAQAEAVIVFARHSSDGRNEQKIRLTVRRSGPGPTDYVVHVHSLLLGFLPAATAVEFLNFLPADAGNSWPGAKRFRETVHEYKAGQFERRPHSPLTVIEPYFWADRAAFRRAHVPEPPFEEVFDPALRERGAAAPFAVSHLYKPMAEGGVLYFAGEKVTPAVRVVRSSAPLILQTCDVWYDEHLCLESGVLQVDGRSLYEVEYELFRLPDEQAQKLTAQAKVVEYSAWVQDHPFAPFFCDQINAFSLPVAREHDGSTGLFFAYENPAHLLSWRRAVDLPERGAIVLNTLDPVEPPSGQYYQSVRYDLTAAQPWAEAFPLGFALHVARGETVEFSALLRTEGSAHAWLEMREAFWGKYQREDLPYFESQVVKTAEVHSACWMRAGDRLTARIPGSLSMIYLAIAGRGRAFFTELLVRRVLP